MPNAVPGEYLMFYLLGSGMFLGTVSLGMAIFRRPIAGVVVLLLWIPVYLYWKARGDLLTAQDMVGYAVPSAVWMAVLWLVGCEPGHMVLRPKSRLLAGIVGVLVLPYVYMLFGK